MPIQTYRCFWYEFRHEDVVVDAVWTCPVSNDTTWPWLLPAVDLQPILPPITRMANVRAATVAIKSSGQMMVATTPSAQFQTSKNMALTDNRSWNHNASNSQPGKNKQAP